MSLIISTGTNLGDRKKNLTVAKQELEKYFDLIASSSIVESAAVDYLNQPDFLNQVLEFKIPQMSPKQTLKQILCIEKSLGRIRDISKGPRIIDIDIIFWGTESININSLTIPHPSWAERSFIAIPLKDLPFHTTISEYFRVPTEFNNTCYPYS
jgi:2-amino-4-hydroxy-6-hydroxymethyldihydropteridine diphosphokinase